MVAVSDASLGGALCLNLRTFRKDGLPIDTPVWVVDFEGHLALFCDDRSYKAKRARRNPKVEVAPCDVWGKCSGPWQAGVCRVVEDPERRARIFKLIAQKYGVHWTMATLGKQLTGQIKHRVVFEVLLDEGQGTGPSTTTSTTTSTTAVVRVSDVYKAYARGPSAVNAVRGVSLAVEAGEMVAIVGPSGSGKSTLLNLLGALDRPSRGEVIVDGARLSELDDTARTLLRRDRIGFVFQFFNLLPLLNARENVALPLLLAGVSRAEAERRADELLGRVGLSGRADHTPDQLSGGEMQRVALARALSSRPVLILADEPTGNLDSEAGAGVLALLKSAAREQRCAIIMVTHDPRAAAVADRVLEFGDGKLVGERFQPQSVAPPGVRNASVAESS
jgi:putative ABC transport system ATP-binding protein